MKLFFWKHIFNRSDERLFVRRSPAQPVAADLLGLQIHLRPYQTMHPLRVDFQTMPQHPDRSELIGSPQVDDHPARPLVQVQRPSFGERSSARRMIFPRRPSSLVGGHEPVAPGLERQRAGVVEAVPDFLLPQMIEAFVEVLRPVFSRRGEHGRDAQQKAEPDDLSQHVRWVCVPWKRESLSNWA